MASAGSIPAHPNQPPYMYLKRGTAAIKKGIIHEIKDKNTTTNYCDYMTDSRRYIREIKGGYMSIEFYYMMLTIALFLFVLEALDENLPGL